MWRILLCFLLLACSDYNKYDDYIGAKYLGAQYVRDPLGEGAGIDSDPLIRFDAFDCTTFVETALADGSAEKLNQIRYRNGNIDFINRNHFIETDWIDSGMFNNVSAQYAPVATRTITIDKQNWFKKNHNIDTKLKKQTVNLEYIPYEHAQNIKTSKPMIVLFINAPGKIRQKIGTDLAVRHMGFLLPDGRLRHASKSHGQVVDVDFRQYVKQMMENKNRLGIIILEI